MAEYSTRVHGPASAAPTVTHLVARCKVCGSQWQVRSGNSDDARGCQLCDAPKEAITLISERPTYGGATLYTSR